MPRTRTSAGLLLAGLLLGCSVQAEPPQGAPAPVASTGVPASTAPPTLAPMTVVALGDSYTQGFASCGRPGDCPTTSWATGTDPRVLSLLQRLSSAGREVTGRNLSVSGARVGALRRQALAAGLGPADLVVVLIGVNDVCTRSVEAMTPVEQFRGELESALSELDATSPQASLLLLSIPDLGRMADLGAGVPEARAVWDRHGICPPVFGRGAGPGQRASTDAQRRAFDGVLEQACLARPRCTWDGGALAALRFEADFLSPDWFHPSLQGQTQIAEVAERALQRSAVGPAGVEPALGRP